MTGSLLAGLGVGLVGALLLATGMDLQSRAVQAAVGASAAWWRDRRWWAGLALLATAVGTNLVALALAPVSAVQSVNIVALAVSTLLTARSRRVALARRTLLAVAACVTGVLGLVTVLSAHPAGPGGHDLAAHRLAVLTILGVLVLLAAVVTAAVGRTARASATRAGATRALLGLATAAAVFASITTVVKVHVDLVLETGLAAVLTAPSTLLAAGLVLLGGTLASLLLQRAHGDLAAPTVVAGTTLTDTLTAGVIGVLVLGESAPTPLAWLLLLACAAVAVLGVLGLCRALPAAVPEVDLPGTQAAQAPSLVELRAGGS